MNKAYIKDFIAEVYTNKNGSGFAEIPFFNKVLHLIAKEYEETNFRHLITIKQLFYRNDYEKNIVENVASENDANNGFVYLTDDYLYDTKCNKTYDTFTNELNKCKKNVIWFERKKRYSSTPKKVIIPSEKRISLISEKRLYFKHYLYYEFIQKMNQNNPECLRNYPKTEEIATLKSILPKIVIFDDKTVKENIDIWVRTNITTNTKNVPNLSSYYIFTHEQIKLLNQFCRECFETKTIIIQKYIMQIKKEV